MSEYETYEQLIIGHLLKRREELSKILGDPDNGHRLPELMPELIDVNTKLIEFYKDTRNE